jgi:predicted nucleic acid-binding protein
MISKGKGKDPGTEGLSIFVASLSFVVDSGKAKASRDPDDDKFIDCAVSSKSLYIVSGDDDLLSIRSYEDVKIITAKEFVDSFIRKK